MMIMSSTKKTEQHSIKLTLTLKLRLIHSQINIIMTYTYRDDQEDLNDIFFIFISCCDDEIF